MKQRLTEFAKTVGADAIGFARAADLPKESPVFSLMPEAKTVIGLLFRVLRGSYRGVEEGTTYYQYTTMGVECIEETIMPMTSLRICTFLEGEGYLALPQRRHQQIMAEEDSTNPEVDYNTIYRGVKNEVQLDFEALAVACGLGEIGVSGKLLNEDYGPFCRYCFILTDAEIEPDKAKTPHLCDNCGACMAACPGKAIIKEGKVDPWRCSVYYRGASGKTNPFMPPDAFSDLDDRIAIIAGEAEITPERAREILDNTVFYPPVKHNYQSSICGRACDMACYTHLEEKGVLKKTFKTPFRKRERWEYSIDDYR